MAMNGKTTMLSLRGRFGVLSLAVVQSLFARVILAQQPTAVPQLNGEHFRITVVEERGFLDITDGPEGEVEFSGYLIDMIEAVSSPDRANFTYSLVTPSGRGSPCSPQLLGSSENWDYSDQYRSQYNCGAADVTDLPLTSYTSDMYLGMFYVSPLRQLQNQFTIPFLPPFSGTLAMLGTATEIVSFEDLVEQQQAGLQPPVCALDVTASIAFIQASFPDIMVQGFFGDEDDLTTAFQDGSCEIFILDGPLASSFVLRRSQQNECIANGKPIGVIGEPMNFGLSHYAIGMRQDIPVQTVNTISYWLNQLMVCNPVDPNGDCPDGNLASFFEGRGGSGLECGYTLFPQSGRILSRGQISGIVVGSVMAVALVALSVHCYRMSRQEHRFQKNQKNAMSQATKERELNEFLAHEIRNPLTSAIAGLSFVSSMADDPAIIPAQENRESIMSDVRIVDSSLQFVNELLRNMLDIHRTANKHMKLDIAPTDVLRDVFEPVMSVLFMRGNSKVKIGISCPPNLIIRGDRMRLKQIIMNLASNSSKFVQVGFINLRAEVVKSNVYLHVEDSGPGIPASKRGNLFNKFQESLDSLNQGTGIGLCVCKNLSDLMKADIFLDENFDSGVPGCRGTRFTLRLNISPMNPRLSHSEFGLSLNESVQSIDYNDLPSTEQALNMLKELPEHTSVLFVDDDTMVRKMFARSLKRVAPTWTVQEASNGETALRMAEDTQFDLIFMDQYMASIEKQMLGTETVRMLRARGIKGLICGLSANDKEEEFYGAGADGFMLKPFPGKPALLREELLKLMSKVPPAESSPPV